MKLSDLRITVRLGLLGGLFVVGLLCVAMGGWSAVRAANAASHAALERAARYTEAIDTARSAQVEFKIQVQEWKDTLLRGNDPAQFDKYSNAFKKAGVTVRGRLERVNALFGQLGIKSGLVDEELRLMEELNRKYLAALQQYDTANPDSAHVVDKLVKGMDRPPTAKINEIVDFVGKQSADAMAAVVKHQAEDERSLQLMLLGVTAATIAIGAAIMVWLARTITAPLNEAVDIARTVASGDLSTSFDARGNDEIGILMRSLKQMHDNLADIVARVRAGTESIAVASAEVASGSQDLSVRTEQQASSLEETASSMEELTSSVRQSNEHAARAADMAGGASAVAEQGGQAVAQVVQTMGSINEASRKIVDIIGVIDGIAFQTNILALNAAVEAARAGEQGRGFAVVASEVRNLAQRSAAAAKEIKALIGDSVEQVETGSRLVGQAGSTMDDVVENVRRVASIIHEIAAASDQQNAGIDQINRAVSDMDAATQQNAALVEEAAAAAESMQHQAETLRDAVSVFKIDPALVRRHAPPALARRQAALLPSS